MDVHRIVVLFLLSTLTSASPSSLRLSQIVFRHGDRTPSEDFPNNPYDADDWPNGFEQLTQVGMRQGRDLGYFLRDRYDNFINSTYVKDEIYVRSTDKDRTLMTAGAVLAGLYPPRGFQVWDEQVAWQPIPVHTVPYEQDLQLSVDTECDTYHTLYEKALQSDDAKRILRENKEMISYITYHAGWPSVSLENIWDTFDPLNCMKCHNYTWPPWVTPAVFNFVTDFKMYNYHLWFHYEQQRYQKAGPFLKMLTTRMNDFVSGRLNARMKVYLYASHDSVLAAILIALGMFDDVHPKYASALLFELHESTRGAYSVQIYNKNDTTTTPMGQPVPLVIPGCEFDCPLDRFLQLTKDKVYSGEASDWHAECNQQHSSNINGAELAVSVIAGAFVIIIAILLAVWMCKRNTTQGYERL